MVRKRSSQAGVALVEFAIVVPLVMMLLVGILETGRFVYYGILVGNAARAGVQYGAQNDKTAGDTAAMTIAAKNDGQNVAGLSITSAGPVCACWSGTAEATPAPSCTSTTTCPVGYHRVVYVQVTAKGSFTPLIALPWLPSSYAITRQAIMRVAQQ